MKLVLASGNQGKIKEIRALLQSYQWEVIGQDELDIKDVPETGLTFIENALIKARHASKESNLPALADDSGLIVPYLNGAPGIYSARYAGNESNAQNNIDKLLLALKDVPIAKRNAAFYCAIVFLRHAHDPAPIIAQGEWKGRILTERQGNAGFGYDPIFYVESEKCSAAELELTIKNKLSHRGQALQSFLTQLRSSQP